MDWLSFFLLPFALVLAMVFLGTMTGLFSGLQQDLLDVSAVLLNADRFGLTG